MTPTSSRTSRALAAGICGLTDRTLAHGGLWRPGRLPVWVIGDSSVLDTILGDKEAWGKDRDPASQLLQRAMGQGLFPTGNDGLWKQERQLMEPAFRQAKIGQLAAQATEQLWSEQLRGLPRDEPVALLPEFIRLSVGALSEVLLGGLSPQQTAEIPRLAGPVFSGMALNLARVALPNWLPFGGRGYQRAIDQLDAFIRPIIAERQSHGPLGSDLLSVLIAGDPETGYQPSADQIRDELFTLFMAGFDSVAVTLAWLCVYLTRQPAEVIDRLRGDPQYLDWAINEAMRLEPSFPIFFGGARRDIELTDGPTIPQGSQLVFMLRAAHRDPDRWDKPAAFRPDRFENLAIRSSGFMPFGVGPRRCIGEKLALTIARTTMQVTLNQSNLERPADNSGLKGAYGMTYYPADGATMLLRPR